MQFLFKFFLSLMCAAMMACGSASPEPPQVQQIGKDTQNIDNEQINADLVAEDPNLKRVTLPGGKEITFTKGAYCAQIVKELNADSPDFGKAFVLEGIVMDEGRLREADARELSSLVELLALAPHLSILLEGKDAVLLETIKTRLVAEGMGKTRVGISVSPNVGTPQILLKET